MNEIAIANAVMVVLSASLGVNIIFWCTVGIIRFVSEIGSRVATTGPSAVRLADVAVVIPAHNEAVALPKCIAALKEIIPARQIYVASDGSRDATVTIARAAGCRALDIQPNGGKAKAIDRAIRHYRLCDRYKAVLIQDADSEIDRHYFRHALPLFDDPGVAAVAGHVLSRWREHRWLSLDMIFAAYRTRLYRILQTAFQYGQSWKWTNVSYIAPGFASIYRTSALRLIDITAPGLVIEDFNMTFEVQRKRLGRVAYSPRARCSSEDPFSLNDYRKQVQRWYLGFWQTVRRHGVWPGRFWLSLGGLLAELIVISLFALALPFAAVLYLATGIETPAVSLGAMAVHLVSPLGLLALFFAVDYALTLVVAVIECRPSLLVYGMAFPFIRLLDAALFLRALFKSFSAKSDGRWISPERYPAVVRDGRET
ncbi:glycosyltransferase family 2 protein (plasmid) [Mesorhizobium sp. AR02]|uniref:glycosyltransferase n=1 Tax=Mesorhizobium sp. AR02 TaxID=2865837 RepID=UPI00215EEB21|nr:glycosyltransferase family 2 protein [Mesorhizobium sp. AR02]UVK57313.1 glycosyltransferase family 2 protein [Mesorhizobium sp. AR02]